MMETLAMAYTLFSTIARHRLVPVVELDQADDAPFLAEALIEGGLPVIEFTFRTAAAARAILATRERFPEMLVGAGTIVTGEQLQQALDAGAQFLISPGFEPTLAKTIWDSGTPYLPGVATASELQGALQLGFTQCKFFPAEANGGVRFLQILAATFRAFSPTFVPTGGINLNNLDAWLKEPAVMAVGGSWLAARQWINDRDWAAIRESVSTSVRIVKSVMPK
jgi:2-dehydro-3-deoxyphosphogluconate aldolase / (4S)-4-hydroxy-2-oxoglutarate aldolase